MSEKEEEIEFSEEPTQKVEITHKIVKQGEKGKEEKKEGKTDEEKVEVSKENLSAMVDLIAEKTFNERREQVAKALNLDPETIKTPEDLKAYQGILAKRRAEKQFSKKEPPSGSGVGLTGAQTGEDIGYIDPSLAPRFREYSSHEEMIRDLEQTAKEGLTPEIRREAQQALSQLFKKGLKDLERGDYVEFEGEITKALQSKAHETPEEKARRKKESSKWKRKR